MRTPKFTPGPWGLESATRSESGSDLVITDRDGGYTIASCRSATGVSDVEEAEANARLIVAAPDLYAALREYVERQEAEGDPRGLPEYGRACAALVKAEGAGE